MTLDDGGHLVAEPVDEDVDDSACTADASVNATSMLELNAVAGTLNESSMTLEVSDTMKALLSLAADGSDMQVQIAAISLLVNLCGARPTCGGEVGTCSSSSHVTCSIGERADHDTSLDTCHGGALDGNRGLRSALVQLLVMGCLRDVLAQS